jgi:hypothetical protein
MKASGGKADPHITRSIIVSRLKGEAAKPSYLKETG